MLIEVKTRVAWIIDSKVKRKQETYILDKELFAEAEYSVMFLLEGNKREGTVDDYEIVSLKIAGVKEVITQYQGDYSYVATLRETYLQEDGLEKVLRYKVLLWANSISEAMTHTRELASQGYDMQIDGLKEVNYTYLNTHTQNDTHTHNEERPTSSEN